MPTTESAAKEDTPQVAALKQKRKLLLEKMERISKLPSGDPAFDHDAAVQRCKDGIKEIDAELKGAK